MAVVASCISFGVRFVAHGQSRDVYHSFFWRCGSKIGARCLWEGKLKKRKIRRCRDEAVAAVTAGKYAEM